MAAAHRVVMDTLCVRLGLIRGLTLLSRHHSPILSIVDEFNQPDYPLFCISILFLTVQPSAVFGLHGVSLF